MSRLIFVDPNDIAAKHSNFSDGNEYNKIDITWKEKNEQGGTDTIVKSYNSLKGDNITFNVEDLNYLVDIKVVIPNRSLFSNNSVTVEKIIENSKTLNIVSFFNGSKLEDDKNFLTDDYINVSYSEIKDGSYVRKEALGIDSIDIDFNAQFFPQVTMVFTDVRAMALFGAAELNYNNGLQGKHTIEESFFKSFFHFPYPFFLLTVKGFYGTKVTFMLAPNDFKSNFEDEGNFKVEIRFIGYLYSFYSDIPMNYLLIAPYIQDNTTSSNGKLLNINQTWRNKEYKYDDGTPMLTFLQFLKNIMDFKNGKGIDESSISLEEANSIKKEEKLQDLKSKIFDIKNSFSQLLKGTPISFPEPTRTETKDDYIVFYIESPVKVNVSRLVEIIENAITEFNTMIEDNNDIDKKLKIGEELYNHEKYLLSVEEVWTENEYKKYNFLKGIIESWKLTVDEGSPEINKDGSVYQQIYFINKKYILDKCEEIYQKIDSEIGKNRITNKKIKDEISAGILGFKPTVKNIIKMIFAHLETFILLFNESCDYDNIYLTGKRRVVDFIKSEESDINASILPPYFGYQVTNNSTNVKELTYPGKIPNSNFSEVNFVERFLMSATLVNSDIVDKKSEIENSNETEENGNETEENGNEREIKNNNYDFYGTTIFDYELTVNPYLQFKNRLANGEYGEYGIDALIYNLYLRLSLPLMRGIITGDTLKKFVNDGASDTVVNTILNNELDNLQQVFTFLPKQLRNENYSKEDFTKFIRETLVKDRDFSVASKTKLLGYHNSKITGFNDMGILKNSQDKHVIHYNDIYEKSEVSFHPVNKRLLILKKSYKEKIDAFFNKNSWMKDYFNDYYNIEYEDTLLVSSDAATKIFYKYERNANGTKKQIKTSKDTSDYNHIVLKEVKKKGAEYSCPYLVDLKEKSLSTYFQNKVVNGQKQNSTLQDLNIPYEQGSLNMKFIALRFLWSLCWWVDRNGEEGNHLAPSWRYQTRPSKDGYIVKSNRKPTIIPFMEQWSITRFPKIVLLYMGGLEYFRKKYTDNKSYETYSAFNKMIKEGFEKEVYPKMENDGLSKSLLEKTPILCLGTCIDTYQPFGKNEVKLWGFVPNNYDGVCDINKDSEITGYKYIPLLMNWTTGIYEGYREIEKDDIVNYFTEWVDSEEFKNIYGYLIVNKNEKKFTWGYDGLNNEYYELDDKLQEIIKTLFFDTVDTMCVNYHKSEIDVEVLIKIYKSFLKNYENKEEELSSTSITSIVKDDKSVHTSNDDSAEDVANENKTSLYYTLSNLYRKWNGIFCDEKRFSLDEDKNEYKRFRIVDNFQNDLSDSLIINTDKLMTKLNDCFDGKNNYSIMQFLSDLAKDNSLLLLTLPMSKDDYTLEDVESIFIPNFVATNQGDDLGDTSTSYIFMYMNEPSKFLDQTDGMTETSYKNDGFDLSDTTGFNFSMKTTAEVEELFGNEGYNTPGFMVSYGKQNQTYFNSIEINMDNPKVTDVSILNQLEIAKQASGGDKKYGNFIGQNIFSIYSNRSYTCTVEMLGCINIMPMMFFQLNNIPMFKGAYMIIEVSHHISGGNMTTLFKGIRVSKNRYPLVSSISLSDNIISRIDGTITSTSGEDDFITARTSNSKRNPNIKIVRERYYTIENKESDAWGKNWGKNESPVWAENYELILPECTYNPKPFDAKKAAKYATDHSYDKYDKETCGHCGDAVKKAVSKGLGISSDWFIGNGAYCYKALMERGFDVVARGLKTREERDKWTKSSARIGDIALMEMWYNKPEEKDGQKEYRMKSGHVCMWCGERWISDFKQNEIWVYNNKNGKQQPVTDIIILRYRGPIV